MNISKFSILITTKNRLEDLKITLNKISYLLENKNVECIICDDGSTDGTYRFLQEHYKQIKLLKNEKSKGLIFSRNLLLNTTKAEFAITLDDDANIITETILKEIDEFFNNNKKCGVIAFRIFWGKELPKNLSHQLKKTRVKGYVGCGHVWRMAAWKTIPNYPEWFIFYGEEEFASYQLFKKQWEIWYLPEILVQHRVDVKARKQNKDYTIRLRRSLRSGWYLYFMFYPVQLIPRKFLYTLWIQLKLKVLKGDLKALKAIFVAFLDLLVNFFRYKNNNRLTLEEFKAYKKIADTKIYWNTNNA